jgi:Family of unknown function (DUF6491)
MRSIALLIAGAGLAACSTAPDPVTRSAQGQAEYDMILAGKVAGTPIDCLPRFDSNDMRAIDDQTAIFRVNPSKAYVTHFNGQCNNLGDPGYALVTKQAGSSNLCRGDIAQMIQTSTGVIVGSCVIGSFVPYTTPGR